VTSDRRQARRASRLSSAFVAKKSTARRGLAVLPLVAPPNVFHAVLELQFLLFEFHFLEKLWFREVGLGYQFVEPIVELAVLVGKRVKFLVGLQQLLNVL
jgi:hypothetical protein